MFWLYIVEQIGFCFGLETFKFMLLHVARQKHSPLKMKYWISVTVHILSHRCLCEYFLLQFSEVSDLNLDFRILKLNTLKLIYAFRNFHHRMYS